VTTLVFVYVSLCVVSRFGIWYYGREIAKLDSDMEYKDVMFFRKWGSKYPDCLDNDRLEHLRAQGYDL